MLVYIIFERFLFVNVEYQNVELAFKSLCDLDYIWNIHVFFSRTPLLTAVEFICLSNALINQTVAYWHLGTFWLNMPQGER